MSNGIIEDNNVKTATSRDITIPGVSTNSNRLVGLQVFPPLKVLKPSNSAENADDLRALNEALAEGPSMPFDDLLKEFEQD